MGESLRDVHAGAEPEPEPEAEPTSLYDDADIIIQDGEILNESGRSLEVLFEACENAKVLTRLAQEA